MGGDTEWKCATGARLKKLMYAFRFALGGSDAEILCAKVDGKCTGKSRLAWQRGKDDYTDECPALLIRRYGHLFNIWQQWKVFGNWEGGGSLDQPNLWMRITEVCEVEYKARSKDRPVVEGIL